jgi:hypothetical protein
MITLQWSKRVRELEEAEWRERRLRARLADAHRWLSEYEDVCDVLNWVREAEEDPATRGNMDVSALRDALRARRHNTGA